MWNISLPYFRTQYATLLKGGIHTMYCVKWKMTILILIYFIYGCKYSNSPNCNYYGELENLTHIYVTCSRCSGLF